MWMRQGKKCSFSREELCHLSIDNFICDADFKMRVCQSPLFKHMGDDPIEVYKNRNIHCYNKISKLVPGHNQACERLVKELTYTKDINRIVARYNVRKARPRTGKKKRNINKAVN